MLFFFSRIDKMNYKYPAIETPGTNRILSGLLYHNIIFCQVI
jgi:hypothetical protein